MPTTSVTRRVAELVHRYRVVDQQHGYSVTNGVRHLAIFANQEAVDTFGHLLAATTVQRTALDCKIDLLDDSRFGEDQFRAVFWANNDIEQIIANQRRLIGHGPLGSHRTRELTVR